MGGKVEKQLKIKTNPAIAAARARGALPPKAGRDLLPVADAPMVALCGAVESSVPPGGERGKQHGIYTPKGCSQGAWLTFRLRHFVCCTTQTQGHVTQELCASLFRSTKQIVMVPSVVELFDKSWSGVWHMSPRSRDS